MNILASDALLLMHASFGVLSCLAATWVFVEALNARLENAARTHTLAVMVAACMAAAWIAGGYWYLHFYPPEKAMILKGPWPLAHSLFMETKEHLFFVSAILSFLLPIATREKLHLDSASRKVVLSVSMLIVITSLAIEGAGAVIDHGVKMAILGSSIKRTH
jgi:hypothetical protein